MKRKDFYCMCLAFVLSFPISQNLLGSGSEGLKQGTKLTTTNLKRKALKDEHKKEIVAVFAANEALHAAFFNFNAKKVEAAAKNVAAAISNLKNPKVKKLLNFSAGKLNEMTAEKGQDKLNQNYHLVSMALIHVLKSYDIGKEYNAYSCPMVKKKWVQNSIKMAKIHNPYSAEMPACGSQDTVF